VETGRFEAAIAHLERAVEVDPKHSAAYLALGRAWEGADQIDRAKETFEHGIEVAARQGDLMTANRMQERLLAMESEAS
jgi:Tfp pilus assembly protein PilF